MSTVVKTLGVKTFLGAVAGSAFALTVALALALAPQGAEAATGNTGKNCGKTGTKSASKAAATPKVASKNLRKAKPASVVRKAAVVATPASPTFGQMYGLHSVDDPLDLKSSVALVMDQDTNEVLLSKNTQAVLPIASITKLMTALVVVEAGQSLDDKITISDEDRDTEKGTGSRLAVGTTLTRAEMLHLALMSSENRAANALGRHYPGGLTAFVAAMNQKAQALGMTDTHYVEPTGLSSRNQSSAKDLAALVKVAHEVPLLREYSTTRDATVALGRRQVAFHNTNGLVRSGSWDIGLQKTGFINEAGRCLVMQASLAGRKLIMVLLDSTGKYSRIGDAERIRKWLTNAGATSSGGAQPQAQMTLDKAG